MSAAPMRPQAKRERPARQPHRLRTILLVLVGFLLLIPAFGYATLQGWVPEPVITGLARLFVGRQDDAILWRADQPANVLILGLQIGGASTNPLTDALMVGSYQPDGSVSLLSIPRDLWVEIPGHGEARINEAFQDGGPFEAMMTVQQNLGVPVNYYALVSYEAFEKLIDDLGGVTIDVPQDIDDPTFPAADEIHYEPFHITQGIHHLNGHEALRYARTRHADTDFGRAGRQQQVLMAVKEQLMKPANWVKLPTIMRDVRALVRTNFPFDQAAALGLRLLRADDVQREVLQYQNKAVSGFTTAAGASVLMPNDRVISEIVERLFSPSLAYFSEGVTVRVDNGNGYRGAATLYGNLLEGLGATVTEPGDADRNDYPTSKVRVYGGSAAALREGRLIAAMLGAEFEEARGSSKPEIVVTLGRDFAPYVHFTAEDWREAITPR